MPPKSSRAAASKPASKSTAGTTVKRASAKVAPRTSAPLVLKHLAQEYPEVTCALEHKSAFQLLMATILSAQCTDERVNMVTPELFRRWPTPAALAAAPLDQIENVIHSTGFYRNKAKNMQSCSRTLADEYNGDVPQDIAALVQLAGVGRKTANVVLGTCYGLATGVVVDTHVTRLSNRLGLTKHTDPIKIEKDLMELIPQHEWVDFAHRMIHHGRRICMARKPNCEGCSMRGFCPKIGVP